MPLLDIMMPKMDGITVLKGLSAQGSPIPIIILTAKAELDHARKYSLANGTVSLTAQIQNRTQM